MVRTSDCTKWVRGCGAVDPWVPLGVLCVEGREANRRRVPVSLLTSRPHGEGGVDPIGVVPLVRPPFVRIWPGHMHAAGKAVEAGVKGPGRTVLRGLNRGLEGYSAMGNA